MAFYCFFLIATSSGFVANSNEELISKTGFHRHFRHIDASKSCDFYKRNIFILMKREESNRRSYFFNLYSREESDSVKGQEIIESKSSNGQGKDYMEPAKLTENEFEPLDIMLNRARTRISFAFTMARIQSLFGESAFPNTPLWFLKRSDLFLVLLAISPVVDAKGFAFGLILGKVTERRIRKILPKGVVQANLVQFWPVTLAIVCDQFS